MRATEPREVGAAFLDHRDPRAERRAEMQRSFLMKRRAATVAGAVVAAGLLVVAMMGPIQARADHLPVHGEILARGPFADHVNLKLAAVVAGHKETVKVRGAADTIVQQVTVQPGGFTGWHSHPGPAVVVVQQGALTYYDGEDPSCTPYTYGPGETFVDLGQGHVHSARNEGTEVVEIFVTYFDVPPDVTSPFVPADDPGYCDF
jgi:quercetin dioxygenase-like cupin family protein